MALLGQVGKVPEDPGPQVMDFRKDTKSGAHEVRKDYMTPRFASNQGAQPLSTGKIVAVILGAVILGVVVWSIITGRLQML